MIIVAARAFQETVRMSVDAARVIKEAVRVLVSILGNLLILSL